MSSLAQRPHPAEGKGDSPSKATIVSAPQLEGAEDTQVQGCHKVALGLRAMGTQG